MIQLEIVKAITRYWGIHDDEPGAYALQCCAAAAAHMEAKGERYGIPELVEAFAYRRKRDLSSVADELLLLGEAHGIDPAAAIRFMAEEVEKLVGAVSEFGGGRE